MAGLVAKQIHADPGSQTAAQQGDQKQGPFRNAPPVQDRLALIQSHGADASQIDKNKPDCRVFHRISFPRNTVCPQTAQHCFAGPKVMLLCYSLYEKDRIVKLLDKIS